MHSLDQKSYYLEKYKEQDVMALVNRKLIIHKQLRRPPRSYCVYSDLHGSYDKYVHWMKNGLGYSKIIVGQVLGHIYSKEICDLFETTLLVVSRSRFEKILEDIDDQKESAMSSMFSKGAPKFFIECLDKFENLGLGRERVLTDFIEILRVVTRGDERRIIKTVPKDFLENVLKLYEGGDEDSYKGLVAGICEQQSVFSIVLLLIVKLVINNLFDKHINLGDTYDRGEGADHLISFYRNWFDSEYTEPLHYIWGNHDILWMGAALGNPLLCIDAIRISMRYNNVDFLSRYGFNLDKLKKFSLKTYEQIPTSILVKKLDTEADQDAARMCKALLVMQSKLVVGLLGEVQNVPGYGYDKELKRHRALLDMLPTGVGSGPQEWKEKTSENPLFLDVYYPTVNNDKREKLTSDEQEVIDDLVEQFTSLPKLRKDIQWMFEKGESYRVVDNTLYFHAAIPCTSDCEFDEDMGLNGKPLYDMVQRRVKELGEKVFSGGSLTTEESMMFWHLWCGEKSVFFCKSKMATLERSIFDKELAASNPHTTWAEIGNPYYKAIRDDRLISLLMKEFHASKVCMGHTPVKTSKQAILSSKNNAFLLDGGASKAYGDKGVVMIHTPQASFLTMHPPLDTLIEAENNNRLAPIKVTHLDMETSDRLADVDKGYYLKEELKAIDEILANKISDFTNGYFY